MGKGKIAIIGGGISGMCAAIFAAKNGANVTIFELNQSLGKKILKTGNGRCNFANEDTNSSHYHTNSKEYIKSIFQEFSLDSIIEFFDEIGIEKKSINGLLYPYSMQAKAVRDCLVKEVEILNINVALNYKVNRIIKDSNRFVLDTGNGVFPFDGVIMANGGMAAPETGSDGNGFYLAKDLGFNIYRPLPALCPIVCDDIDLAKASGVRIDSCIIVESEGKKYKEYGNLQITDYGISGICVMQLSYLVARAISEKKQIKCEIDFLPDIIKSDLKKILNKRFNSNARGKTVKDAFTGLLPDKLIITVLNKINCKMDSPAINISKDNLNKLLLLLKSYPIKIVDVKGFTNAQTTFGGIDLSELDKKTLISKKYKNLGFCGEILDVCGDCGGYNIMWAISSGAVVGKSLAGGL